MTETKKTNDYDIFKKHPANRSIDSANLKRIRASIQANNLLEFKPILVDAQYRVIDGQHRLEIAKELQLPIYYQIKQEATDEDIVLLCDAQKSWGVEDYCRFYETKGKIAYLTLRELSNKTGYPVGTIVKSLWPKLGANTHLGFRHGKLPNLNDEEVRGVLEDCDKIAEINNAITKFCFARRINFNSSGYLRALKSLFDIEGFDLNTFIRKISAKAEIIRSCSSSFAYLQMFKDVYNYRNNNPIE